MKNQKKWIGILCCTATLLITRVDAAMPLIAKPLVRPATVVDIIHRVIPSVTLQRVQFVYQVYHLLDSTIVKL